MFPGLTTLGTNRGVPTNFGQVGNSHATTPNNAAFFAYISVPSVMLSRKDSIHSSKAKSATRFDVPS